jgi:hypothetical protein
MCATVPHGMKRLDPKDALQKSDYVAGASEFVHFGLLDQKI